jgi:hypothetical protein
MLSKVRLGSILALALMFSVSLAMRADTVFSSFGPSQSYQPKSWVDVGNGGSGDQVVAFPFVPTETAYLTSVDAALYNVGPTFALSIWNNSSNGMPGNAVVPLDQIASFPGPGVANFGCGMLPATCPVLEAGHTYWLVAQQQSDPSALTYFFFSPTDTGTWYYDETGNAGGPWTAATLSDSIGAFDVNGLVQPASTPEPASLVLLGSAMLGMLVLARRRFGWGS